ncbi:hypothetical protein D3C75_1226960 [compost metagenome]
MPAKRSPTCSSISCRLLGAARPTLAWPRLSTFNRRCSGLCSPTTSNPTVTSASTALNPTALTNNSLANSGLPATLSNKLSR